MQKLKKERIDILLFKKGLTESREKSSRLILAGQVFVNGMKIVKPGINVDENSNIEIKNLFPYVGKGALKLESAYEYFNLNFKDKIIADIGSSTGGFTDFCLQKGAKKVYAIDIGHGQLAQKLRESDKVICMEKCDIRDVESLPEDIDIFVIDVSFISLEKILPKVRLLITGQKKKSEVICLVKPQFEVGKAVADKFKGVITDQNIQRKMLEKIITFSKDLDFIFKGEVESKIKGNKGNQEFLIYLI
jgi:23S rRNA (cytidine1920-2'-O)/16S rRNA (cytidine1409-2'-O)-methyltransferase